MPIESIPYKPKLTTVLLRMISTSSSAWWSAATMDRLRSSVFQILAQAGYIANTRTLTLQPVYIASPVLDYLTAHQEHYVLRCIQVAP